MGSIASCGFWQIDFLLWESSVQFICHFLIGSLTVGEFRFLASCIFSLSSLFQMHRCKDVLTFCGWPLQFRYHFFCCAEAFVISCTPICTWQIAKPFEFNWGSQRLCLLIPEYSQLFPTIAAKFQVLY
jgi:hypothetical protein